MHQRSVDAGVNLGGQVAQRGVKAMVEADLDAPPCLLGGLKQRLYLGGPERRRLLDQDVAAGLQCPLHKWRQLVVRGGDDHDVGPKGQELVDVGADASAVLGHELGGPRGYGVGCADDSVGRPQRLCALASDQPASGDRDGQPGPVRTAAGGGAHAYSLD